jgi:hypothetical protein
MSSRVYFEFAGAFNEECGDWQVGFLNGGNDHSARFLGKNPDIQPVPPLIYPHSTNRRAE